jgi:hypothetical protein
MEAPGTGRLPRRVVVGRGRHPPVHLCRRVILGLDCYDASADPLLPLTCDGPCSLNLPPPLLCRPIINQWRLLPRPGSSTGRVDHWWGRDLTLDERAAANIDRRLRRWEVNGHGGSSYGV